MFETGFRNGFLTRGPVLGQLESLIGLIPQLLSTGVQAYGSKRAADQVKQAKARAEEQQKQAAAAQQAAADAKAKADQALRDQMQAQQGLAPQGVLTGQSQNQILGMDPMVLAGGGLALVAVGAAVFFIARKK